MKIVIAIVVIIVVAGLALSFGLGNMENDEILADYTPQDVAAHDTRADCWTIIDGRVYDITNYIPIHPGGEHILQACGRDASSFFNSRTDDQGETIGSGEAHSQNARSVLNEYLIGELTN